MLLLDVPEILRAEIGINLGLKKVIHIGANKGQEAVLYDNAGIEGYHVEAHPGYFLEVEKSCSGTKMQKAVQACCFSVSGQTVEFNVTNNTESSSVLPLGRHALAYPLVEVTEKIQLTTTTVDDLVAGGLLPADPDMLLLDVQGAEGHVLEGATKLLESDALWGLLIESSLDPLYDGGSSFDDVYTRILKPRGYFLKTANFNEHGWTDVLFLKRWWRLPDEEAAPLVAKSRARNQLTFEGRDIGPEGRCSQSSFSQWSTTYAEAAKAVEGQPSGSYSFHTSAEENSWWMIEWDAPQKIDEIILFNRVNGGPSVRERINGALIEYSPDGESWNLLYKIDGALGGVHGEPLNLKIDPILAKRVRVRQPTRSYLHFDRIYFIQK